MALRNTKVRRPDELSSVRECVSNAGPCSVGLRDCQTCSGENTAVIHSTAWVLSVRYGESCGRDKGCFLEGCLLAAKT